MTIPKPDKTIDQLFEQFLADQKARLSPKTYDKYEGIIHLYCSYLESYWPGHSGDEDDAITKAKGTSCGTFGAKVSSGNHLHWRSKRVRDDTSRESPYHDDLLRKSATSPANDKAQS